MFDVAAVKESFGRAATQYDAHAHLQREVRAYCLKLAQQHWPATGHMLDAGCGTGMLQQEARAAGVAWKLSGIDVSPGMCAQAKQHRLPVVGANAEAMPFAAESFDGLLSSLMLQWINNPAAVFAEMARVLKPGACAVIATLASGTLQELQEAFSAIDGRPHVSDFLEPHALLASAELAGLSLVAARQAKLVEHYTDTIALMRALQAIGATNKQATRRKGLMTPSQFTRLEKIYTERFADKQGLPASWQVLTLVLKKSA